MLSERECKLLERLFFVLTRQTRVQAMILNCTKAEARIKKERARKVLILNLDFMPLKRPVKKNMAILGNQTIGIPALLKIPLIRLLHGMARDFLHGGISPFETCPSSDTRCSGS